MAVTRNFWSRKGPEFSKEKSKDIQVKIQIIKSPVKPTESELSKIQPNILHPPKPQGSPQISEI